MQNFKTFGLSFLFLIGILSSTQNILAESPKVSPESSVATANAQQLVENVDIQGNRRYRDEDLLYYIKTRAGDVFNQRQLESDLTVLLSLNFFDKIASKVLTEPGERGGVRVIFEVKELPVIRDLQFKGTKAITESDILKKFREDRVGVSKESTYNPVNNQKAKRAIRELLAAKGYPNAEIEVTEEEVSATSVALTFDVKQGNRSRIVEIDFVGNEFFKDSELRGALELVKKTGLISRFKGQDILDLRKLQYDLQKNVRQYMSSKGYFQARIGEPEVVGLGYKQTGFLPIPLPLLSSKDDTLKIVVPVTEGRVFRAGDVKVEGNSIFSEEQIVSVLGLKKGEIVDGKRIATALDEDLPKIYGSQGFVTFSAEPEPDYKDNPSNPKEGIVDFKIVIDEGKQFRLRRLEFSGNTFTRDKVLRREVLVNEGDIYNQINIERSVLRLNQTQYFDPIDKDKDLEIRTDDENGEVDLIMKVRERGRQQIQFNGGISGIGGSFFGFEYSTNNLMGRGETFSANLGFGNRQRTFQLGFQQPYFRDRPINVGFSVFGSSYKFFGQGTFLSQNTNAFLDALNPINGDVDEQNLFTQTTYGASVFATAPLSELLFRKRAFTQFSRVGLTYQFSATSIADPPVNRGSDPTKFIPILFRQPNITTSRITGSFVYDTRQPSENGIDMLRGKQITASIAFSGLGGDVRTYQPSISYSQFIPVRRKRSGNAEVFGFRILAGTIAAFSPKDKIVNSNSLSYINGVPFYERYFLGSENDIRGYDSRSIGPLAPVNSFIQTQDLVVATNAVGTPVLDTILTNAAQRAQLLTLGSFGAPGTATQLQTGRTFQPIGGDTQILGNFEYRIPIFGPVMVAAYADVGSVFNLRNGGIQNLSSGFQDDQPFLGSSSINNILFSRDYVGKNFDPTFFAQNPITGGFLVDNGSLISYNTYISRYCTDSNADGVPDQTGCPSTIPTSLKEVFLRGKAQTISQVDLANSVFSKFGDFRASVGFEVRVQVPVVNVPFRLIYYYNPLGKFGFTEEAPGFPFFGKRSGFKFTVGRTF